MCYDLRIFDRVKNRDQLTQFQKVSKEQEKSKKSSTLFRFTWLESEKELKSRGGAEEGAEKTEAFEEKIQTVHEMGDFTEIENLKKYEITR